MPPPQPAESEVGDRPRRRPSRPRCRLLATLWLAAALARPGPGAAEEIYSFVDAAGVVHYSNVPQDRRYQRVHGERERPVTNGPQGPRARTEPRGEGITAARTPSGRAALPLPRRTAAFDEHIRDAARRYRLAPLLLKAVMAAESNFDPAAVSEKGATGLMQLMPETARDMYVRDALDPAQNIEGGARYLRHLQDRFGDDLERVLAAYNAGPERVRRAGGAVPAIPETQAYVRKVLRLYASYLSGG